MPRLSRERICREALALVDDEGLDALSMRRLGARLGVEAMSLYRHVRDKTDLLVSLQGAVIGRLVAPRGKVRPWRKELGGQARSLRRLLLAHPNVAPLLARMPVQAPEAAVTVGRAHESLLRAGLTPAAAMDAIYLVGIFTIGHVLFEIQSGGDRPPAVFHVGLESLLDGVDRRRRAARKRQRGKKSR